MDVTNDSYLEKVKADSEKAAQKQSPKALYSAKVFLIVVLACTGIILAGGSIWAQMSLKAAYDNYNSGASKVEFKTLNYENTFTQWNSKSLGNDINLLLIGGKEYFGKDFNVRTDYTYDNTIVTQGNSTKKLAISISYVNYWDGTLYYRNDTDHSIYTYDIKKGQSSKLLECNTGEVLIADGKLYYVDLKNNNQLICTDLNGKNGQVICDKSVLSFVVCGDALLFEDTSLTLYLKGNDSSVITKLCSSVERYFLNGEIIIESGNNIFSIAPDSGKAVKLNNFTDDECHLVGAKQGSAYIDSAGVLYEVDEAEHTRITDNTGVSDFVYQGPDGKLYRLSYGYNSTSGMTAKIETVDTEEQS